MKGIEALFHKEHPLWKNWKPVQVIVLAILIVLGLWIWNQHETKETTINHTGDITTHGDHSPVTVGGK